MPISVLQLGPYPPPEGGVSRNMLAIREGLLDRGDTCSIIATSRSNSVRPERDVHHPDGPAEILKLLWSINYDVLHLHVGGELNNRVLALATAASLFAGKRSVLTVHSGAFPLTVEAKNASRWSKHGFVFRRFGSIIAVNDALEDVYRRFGIEEERIYKILPFALTLPDESVSIPSDLAEFYAAHSPVLLSVGGLAKDYDPLFQVEAMERIVKVYPNAGLILAGDGSMRSEVDQAILNSRCKDSVLSAGNIEHPVTLHLIQQADILLRTTLFDGDAISIREALFLGTPVIATDNGMRPEGTHLIKIGDSEGLVSMIGKVLDSQHRNSTSSTGPIDNTSSVLALYDRLSAT